MEDKMRPVAPADGTVVDLTPQDRHPACIICGTWVCSECRQFERPYALRGSLVDSTCGRCGSTSGFYRAVRHRVGKIYRRLGHSLMPRQTPFVVLRQRRLPVCMAPIPIHPNPTRWLSDEAAKHWVQKVISLDERKKMELPSKSACAGGDPCPGTGCPACCPSYDPCGLPECQRCNPLKGENMNNDEPDGGHEEYIRSMEENSCGYGCIVEGVNDSECSIHGGVEDESKSRYPFKDTDDTIVIGPECFSHPDRSVIAWQGEYYYHREGPVVASVETERLAERRAYLRRDAMQWAVDIQKAKANTGPLDSTADMIYNWLIKED